jgi:hypothetical protein
MNSTATESSKSGSPLGKNSKNFIKSGNSVIKSFKDWAATAAPATGPAIAVKGCSSDPTLAASALAYAPALSVKC